MTVDCVFCGHALQCPDGSLRCEDRAGDDGLTPIAKELCDNFATGGAKIYTPKPKAIPKKVRVVKAAKAIKLPPVKPAKVAKSGKMPQGRLL